MTESKSRTEGVLHVAQQGEGQPFVWAHGLTSSIAAEDASGLFQWHQFPDQVRLIRYDACGHGDSAPGNDARAYTWPALADGLVTLSHQISEQSVAIGGQSMGCATSIYAALAAPHKFQRLVLMNPPTAWELRASQGSFYRKMAWLSRLLGGKQLARIMAKQADRLLPYWLNQAQPQAAKGLLTGVQGMPGKTLSKIFKGAAATDLPSPQQLKTITQPCLILAWTDDPSHPLSVAEQLHQLIPNSQLVVASTATQVADWPSLIRDFVLAPG